LNGRKNTKVIDDILRAVRRGRTFFLSGHEKPDGDTVGSELAFASFLRRLGKKVDIYNAEPVPPHLMFLPGADKIKTAKKVAKTYDVAVIFECFDAHRMGDIIDFKTQAGTVINIDHHAHHSFFGHINLINPKASSNSEQLFFVFQKARLPLTRAEAMALYVGLVTDTGRFQQENANPDSHIVAAGLLETGIPVAEIARKLYYTRSESALKLLSRALASLRLELDGRVSVMSLGQRDFAEAGSGPEETEDIINYGLMVPSVQVALLLRELDRPGFVKVSFRGKGLVDLNALAVSYGGGGHKNASGCTVEGTLEQTAGSLLAKLAALFAAAPARAPKKSRSLIKA
jgi:bifunctional oligoribonuclease and PAP phosphatase NrnA